MKEVSGWAGLCLNKDEIQNVVQEKHGAPLNWERRSQSSMLLKFLELLEIPEKKKLQRQASRIPESLGQGMCYTYARPDSVRPKRKQFLHHWEENRNTEYESAILE